MKRLEGKTAVITGGSDGIGLGIAKCFAEEGANLILLGRSEEKLKIAQEALGGYGVKICAMEADLAQSKTIKGLCERILALSLKIDILVNNAGLGKFVPFEATDEALLDAHLNLNVKAPYLLTQGLLGALATSKLRDQHLVVFREPNARGAHHDGVFDHQRRAKFFHQIACLRGRQTRRAR